MENPNESNSNEIRVISTHYVKPRYEVQHSKEPYYLNPVDLFFLSIETMQKGLLFNSKPKNISNLIEKLKISLSQSLVYFYPLAGKLTTQKYHNEHAIWVYVDCTNGPGARIIHAKVDYKVSNIVSSIDVHPIVSSFFDLGEKLVVNYDGHTRPLLSIQVTELIDGVFIGFMMNHSLADGTSLWHFISSLSEIFFELENREKNNCINIEKDPSLDINISRKPIYKPFYPEGYGPILKLPYIEAEEFVARFNRGPLRERIFHFSPKAISMLKAKANEECNVNNISSFQALSAFLWRSITSARNLDPGLDTNCTFIINTRSRLNPPLSQEHFGNYLAPAQQTCKVGELMNHGLGWASLLVYQSLVAQNDNAVREFVYNIVKAPYVAQTGAETAFYNPNSVLIAGSARFDMYGPEFGLGKAVAVLAGYANKDDGKITANPGREGGGSVDLEVCLKEETMYALESNEEFMSFAA